MAVWLYDLARKAYVSASGKVMTARTLQSVRDAYLADMNSLIEDYASNLEAGDWSIMQFETAMRDRLRKAYLAEYTLGRGGAGVMTQADYGRVGQLLRTQYGHLRGFLDDLESGAETRGTARNRAANFLGSARQGFERGRAAAWGITLPAYPGDGGTPCYGNCRCSWRITETKTQIRARWSLSASADTCDGCRDRAAQYSPYTVEKSS